MQEHIVFLTPGFPENEEDSRCIPALQIFLKALKKEFSGTLSVISFQYPYQPKNYQWNGIPIYALGGNNSRFKKKLTWKKAKNVFKTIHTADPVSMVHSFWMGECAAVASALAIEYNIKHSCTLMGQDVLKGNNYFHKVKKVNQLITISHFHQQELKKNYHIDSTIIPWGINQQEQYSQPKHIDVIGVGALTNLKSYHEFIAIIHLLKTDFPNITAKIIGDGVLKNKLQSQIDSLALTEHIELTGLLTYQETQKQIAQSKVLLHVSDFESFGMVVIEALSVHTQVVSKPVGIAKELQEVVKINSVIEAAEKLTTILKNEPKVQIDKVSFSIKNTVKKYVQIFHE